ncbi:cytochrome c [Crocosphaera sp. XPORK-15E]|uniref:c-type cytochrome n=1 Tax=Crocosphaera sp. XPORK-15E TaxID=3110247 RepID=UPI002B1E953A|nr:cytochrome c [Crocosphaera sp. XPORK-15E]MEA5534933.1 cytochrome c [Crocosphaera sp. XPORK-15E]
MAILGSKLGKILITLAVIVLLLMGGVGYTAWYYLKREVPVVYDSPEEHFKYGSINSGGLPYWIWVVLPSLFPEHLPGPGGYTSVGYIWEPGKENPVGISKSTIGFEKQGVTCAMCHSATYRKSPEDTPTLVLGAPAQKFDTQANIRFLSACGKDPRFTADYILPAIEEKHHLSWIEKQLYSRLLIPQTQKALMGLGQGFAWMNSRPDAGPGRIPSFNPVKFLNFGLPLDDTIDNVDDPPLWNEKQHKGFAYHWDGLETNITEVAIMGALAAGTKPDNVPLEDLRRVEDFIREVQPPAYPFEVNQELVAKGKPIFENNCATCHAFGGDRTGTVIPVEEVGTDRHRIDMWTQAAVDKYEELGDGYEWDFTHVQKTDGYVAVSLDGIWLRAPYLHNGSVPYLTDLLEVPENRTPVFYRSYDVYNPEKVGFVSEGPEAAKEGFKYDTAAEANSNQGHLYGTTLPTEDKQALVEYLKTL